MTIFHMSDAKLWTKDQDFVFRNIPHMTTWFNGYNFLYLVNIIENR